MEILYVILSIVLALWAVVSWIDWATKRADKKAKMARLKANDSTILRAFFQDLDHWIITGRPKKVGQFMERTAICGNLAIWLEAHNIIGPTAHQATSQLYDVYNAYYDDGIYPFEKWEKGGTMGYALIDGRLWENPERLNFIKLAAAGSIKGI